MESAPRALDVMSWSRLADHSIMEIMTKMMMKMMRMMRMMRMMMRGEGCTESVRM